MADLFDRVAFGIGPIVVLLAAVPTLGELKGLEPRRPLTLSLPADFVQRNMVYSAKNVEEGRWWTTLSYAFVHESVEHLYCNLALLVPSGINVQAEFGTVAMWATFLGGCALGSTNYGNIKGRQHEVALKSMLATAGLSSHGHATLSRASDGDGDDLLAPLRRWVSRGFQAGANALAPVMSYYAEYVGCSAGCCALLGADFCLSLEVLAGGLGREPVDSLGDGKERGNLALRLTTHVLSVYMTLNLVRDEWTAFQQTGAVDGKDHAAHIVGLAFGAACFVALRLAGAAWRGGSARSRK